MQTDRRPSGRHWLNIERLRLYPWLLVVFYLFMAALIFRPDRSDGPDKGTYIGQGMDFGAFWTASQLALAGKPEQAYDYAAITEAQKVINPLVTSANAWFYPPAFLLLCLPLSLAPYLASYLLFMGASLGGYAALLRRIAPAATPFVLLLGFPGLFQNIVHGQNGFLTAALMGAGLLWLPNRPTLAGIAFGLLTFKPHLGVLIPLALIATRQWRVIVVAGITGLALYATSYLVFGKATFIAFVDAVPQVSEWLGSNFIPHRKSPTFFAFAMLAGQSTAFAYCLQLVVAAVSAALVVAVWLKSANQSLRSAALMTGALLATPHLLEYDLAWLAFPIAWMAADGIRNGWHRGERESLAIIWLTPLGVGWLYDLIHVQLAPFLIFGFLLLIARRALTATVVATPAPLLAEQPR